MPSPAPLFRYYGGNEFIDMAERLCQVGMTAAAAAAEVVAQQQQQRQPQQQQRRQ